MNENNSMSPILVICSELKVGKSDTKNKKCYGTYTNV